VRVAVAPPSIVVIVETDVAFVVVDTNFVVVAPISVCVASVVAAVGLAVLVEPMYVLVGPVRVLVYVDVDVEPVPEALAVFVVALLANSVWVSERLTSSSGTSVPSRDPESTPVSSPLPTP